VTRSTLAGGLLGVVLIVAIGTALVILGSPDQERVRRLDQRRVRDLDGLAMAIDLYFERHGSLPATLRDIEREVGVSAGFRDPASAALYEYQVLEGSRFELCATFDATAQQATDELTEYRFWSHRAGRQCFQRETR
jgi:hypothetical protein